VVESLCCTIGHRLAIVAFISLSLT
jgi:hypothetical protein